MVDVNHDLRAAAGGPRRRRNALFAGGAVIVLLLAIGVTGYRYGSLERRRRRNRAIVVQTADKLEMPPALLLAVAHTESGFDDRAVSHKGAGGLMQVMPATAREVAGRLGLRSWSLRDPRDNALIGGTYLKGLIRRYDGDLHLALAAYHAGPKRVASWRKRAGRGTTGRLVVKRHAFKSTRTYVARVLSARERFRATP